MGAGRVIGGLFAFFGGVLVLVAVFMNIDIVTAGATDPLITWIVNLLVGILALIGGILGMASKGGGGALTLIAGVMALFLYLIGNLLSSPQLMLWFTPYSGLHTLFGWGRFVLYAWGSVIPLWHISFEGFLIFLGAILILNSREEKY